MTGVQTCALPIFLALCTGYVGRRYGLDNNMEREDITIVVNDLIAMSLLFDRNLNSRKGTRTIRRPRSNVYDERAKSQIMRLSKKFPNEPRRSDKKYLLNQEGVVLYCLGRYYQNGQSDKTPPNNSASVVYPIFGLVCDFIQKTTQRDYFSDKDELRLRELCGRKANNEQIVRNEKRRELFKELNSTYGEYPGCVTAFVYLWGESAHDTYVKKIEERLRET